jgi:hypothetical protein
VALLSSFFARFDLRRALPALLVALVAAGCQVQTEVTVEMADDGSGTVEVAVGLDEGAMAELPDLDSSGSSDAADLSQLVRVEDLTSTGWTVGEPEASDGVTWLRITKPFGTPEEAGQILAELTGPEGGLRDLQLSRSRGFGSTSYDFSGTADLSAGLESFGDAGLAEALDGEPLGEDAAAIQERLGQPLAEMLTLDVVVALPGATKTFSPELGGEAVSMSSSSSVSDMRVLGLAGLAVALFVALAVVLVVRWRRAAA